MTMKRNNLILIISLILVSIVITWCISSFSNLPVMLAGSVLALIPFAILVFIAFVYNPFIGLLFMLIVSYFISGAVRIYPGIKTGIIYDSFILMAFLASIIASFRGKVEWKNGFTFGFFLASIWTLYTIFEIFNPEAVSNYAWYSSIRGISFYFLVTIFLSSILLKDYKSVQAVLLTWGILTLIGVSKALIQKYVGFDYFETRWLYRDGGYTTHILATGIRYFSFFSDAASFGGTMGQSMIVYAGLSFFEKNPKRRIFYIIVAVGGAIGLYLSGTRAAMAIPVVGAALFILLSKRFKTILIFTIVLAGSVVFFRYTTIGQSSAGIRRIRSAFFPSEDNSFLVRVENQKKLRAYLSSRPFGAGIGHGGVKAKKNIPGSYLSEIPTDSFFVVIWVETGIVGLILYVTIWLLIMAYCSYLILFKIKNIYLSGMASALLAGVFGILVASYANEILGSLPSSMIIFMSLSIIMACPRYEKELSTIS